jgi:pimeloyl-ACP methyl ester carboxylesterase
MPPPPPAFLGPALSGELFVYAATPTRVAFESLLPGRGMVGPPSSPPASFSNSPSSSSIPLPPYKCILLGGLSDGFVPVPYTNALSDMCCHFQLPEDWEVNAAMAKPTDVKTTDGSLQRQERNPQQVWSLIQPILSSSYTGFGHDNLDRDVREMDELIHYLLVHRNGQKVVLIGHSTGCQQIVHYLKYGAFRTSIDAAVLQAPVSDREAATIVDTGSSSTTGTLETELEHMQKLKFYIDTATRLKLEENKGDEMMPRDAFWAPITANRYWDLMAKGGKDDYFSSDYTEEELRDRLSHITTLSKTLHRVLVVFSGADEFVPKHVDSKSLTRRFCDAMNHNNEIDGPSGPRSDNNIGIAQPLYMTKGDHSLSSNNGTDAQEFVVAVNQLLRQVTKEVRCK